MAAGEARARHQPPVRRRPGGRAAVGVGDALHRRGPWRRPRRRRLPGPRRRARRDRTGRGRGRGRGPAAPRARSRRRGPPGRAWPWPPPARSAAPGRPATGRSRRRWPDACPRRRAGRGRGSPRAPPPPARPRGTTPTAPCAPPPQPPPHRRRSAGRRRSRHAAGLRPRRSPVGEGGRYGRRGAERQGGERPAPPTVVAARGTASEHIANREQSAHIFVRPERSRPGFRIVGWRAANGDSGGVEARGQRRRRQAAGPGGRALPDRSRLRQGLGDAARGQGLQARSGGRSRPARSAWTWPWASAACPRGG